MIKKSYIFLLLVVCAYPQSFDYNNRFMLGQNYEGEGQFDKAKGIYEDLYKSQPDNVQFFEGLNRVYIQLKEYESSIKIIEDRIKKNSSDINLYGMLGNTYYLAGNEKKAFDVWDSALEKLPPNPLNYKTLANYAIQRRAFEKAIDILKKGSKIAGDPRVFGYDLASMYALTMQFKNAAEQYCSLLYKEPNLLPTIQSRIFSYINKPGALKQTIQVVEDWKDRDVIAFSYLLARLYIEDKSYSKAYELYVNIDDVQNNQGNDLYNFGEMLLNDGEYSTAAKAFNEILNKYPSSSISSSAKLGYAKTLEAELRKEYSASIPSWKPYYLSQKYESDNTQKVIDAFSDLINLYPHTNIAYEANWRIGLIKQYIENEPEDAVKYYNKIIKESPLSNFSIEAYNDLGNAAVFDGNLDKAVQNFSAVMNNGRAPAEQRNSAKYRLAQIDFYKGDFSAAKDLLVQVTSNLKDDNTNDAIELSLLLNTSINDSSNLLLFASAELLAEQKKFEKAAEKYRLIASNKQAFMLQSLAQIREAEMEIALNNYENSILLLNKISDENEKNIYSDKALYLLGQIYEYGIVDNSKAVEVYEKLLAKFPNSLYLDKAREEIIKLRNKLS